MSNLLWANKAGVKKNVFSPEQVQNILELVNNLATHKQLDSRDGPWAYLPPGVVC